MFWEMSLTRSSWGTKQEVTLSSNLDKRKKIHKLDNLMFKVPTFLLICMDKNRFFYIVEAIKTWFVNIKISFTSRKTDINKMQSANHLWKYMAHICVFLAEINHGSLKTITAISYFFKNYFSNITSENTRIIPQLIFSMEKNSLDHAHFWSLRAPTCDVSLSKGSILCPGLDLFLQSAEEVLQLHLPVNMCISE